MAPEGFAPLQHPRAEWVSETDDADDCEWGGGNCVSVVGVDAGGRRAVHAGAVCDCVAPRICRVCVARARWLAARDRREATERLVADSVDAVDVVNVTDLPGAVVRTIGRTA